MSWPLVNSGQAVPVGVPPPLPNYAPNNAVAGVPSAPTAPQANNASASVNPYVYGSYQMTPEQQYYVQQQNWQQWQNYQQQYAQWQAQYGEQVCPLRDHHCYDCCLLVQILIFFDISV